MEFGAESQIPNHFEQATDSEERFQETFAVSRDKSVLVDDILALQGEPTSDHLSLMWQQRLHEAPCVVSIRSKATEVLAAFGLVDGRFYEIFILVHPDFQETGIERKMLDELTEYANALGIALAEN